jgi:hypothetical protein
LGPLGDALQDGREAEQIVDEMIVPHVGIDRAKAAPLSVAPQVSVRGWNAERREIGARHTAKLLRA